MRAIRSRELLTMLVALLVGSLCLADDDGWGTKDYREEERFDARGNAYIWKYWVCVPSDECECELDGGVEHAVGIGCSQISISTGNMHPSTSMGRGVLHVYADRPTASLYSPQGMRYILDYTIHSFSWQKTAADLPREVYVVRPFGLTLGFYFEDGESVGYPHLGPQRSLPHRLSMVDAEGWATSSDPAYYDLYPGDGTLYRFVCATATISLKTVLAQSHIPACRAAA